MTDHNKSIEIGVKRAYMSLKAAALLMENGFYDEGVSRLYYACFYIVRALLLQDDLRPTTHKGVQQMFGKNYVIRNILSRETGKFFAELFFMRQESDYSDITEINKEVINELLGAAQGFISEIEKLIKTQE
ncbi:HEPN domain-containing protein [Niabella aquatica]